MCVPESNQPPAKSSVVPVHLIDSSSASLTNSDSVLLFPLVSVARRYRGLAIRSGVIWTAEGELKHRPAGPRTRSSTTTGYWASVSSCQIVTTTIALLFLLIPFARTWSCSRTHPTCQHPASQACIDNHSSSLFPPSHPFATSSQLETLGLVDITITTRHLLPSFALSTASTGCQGTVSPVRHIVPLVHRPGLDDQNTRRDFLSSFAC